MAAVIGFALSIVVAPVGLIVSIVALVQARRSGGAGRRLAIAGITIPCLWIVAAIAIPVFLNSRLAGQRAAEHSFRAMESALVADDCHAFEVWTTPRLQQQLGLTDCTQFDNYVAQAEAMGGFSTVPIVDITRDGDTVTVTTVERLGLGEGRVVERVEYTLVHTDGRWRVDSVALAK